MAPLWWDEPSSATALREPPPQDPGLLAEAAKRLLDDPVLQLALDRMEAKLTETWRHTALGQTEAREAAYRLHWACEQFRSELRVMVGAAAMGRQQTQQ
jgi:hypothetical protein